VQRVLDGAGIRRATLYNHFTDVDTLIEAALVATFTRVTDLCHARLAGIADEAPDQDAFRDKLRSLIREFSRLPPTVRLRQTHTIALSATHPQWAKSIVELQNQTAEALSTTIRDAQVRGFLRSDLDPHATAVMGLSVRISRFVDDAADHRLGDERWAAAYFNALDKAMLTPED